MTASVSDGRCPTASAAAASSQSGILNAFTAGPWFAVPYGDGQDTVICADEAGNFRIAFMAIAGGDGSARAAKQREIKASAHLIAAAPAMLSELDWYADQLCEGWCEGSPDCANFEDCGGCRARRAAWLARGEAS